MGIRQLHRRMHFFWRRFFNEPSKTQVSHPCNVITSTGAPMAPHSRVSRLGKWTSENGTLDTVSLVLVAV